MPVKSLMELAGSACIKNIRALESVGDYLPYENVRTILLKVDNAHQLRRIELNSPQIQGATGEIWLKLIERDFPMEYKAKGYKPQNPDKWYRVWEKYKRDHDDALAESENKLKNALAGLRQHKEENTSKIVDQKYLPRPPRTGPKRGGPRDTSSSTLTFGLGSRTKTANGASVMRKVRREVKEIATIHGSLSKSIRGAGSAGLAQIRKAPAAMINDHRRANQPSYLPTNPAPAPAPEPSAVTEHERTATFISDSDEEGEDTFSHDQDNYESQTRYSKPIRKVMGQSAATSLLKKRPAAMPSSSSPQKAVKKSSGLLSNKYKGTAVKATVTKGVTSPPIASKQQYSSDTVKKSHYLPRTQTSPPLSATAGPASPPAQPLALEPETHTPPVQPRKRKAVDIFMRPKKRAF